MSAALLPLDGRLIDDVELDPVDQGVVGNRTGVRCPLAKRLQIRLTGLPDVRRSHRAEWDQFDRVDLDRGRPDRVPAARPHPRPLPQPERNGDVARYDVVAQLPAKLHHSRVKIAPNNLSRVSAWYPDRVTEGCAGAAAADRRKQEWPDGS